MLHQILKHQILARFKTSKDRHTITFFPYKTLDSIYFDAQTGQRTLGIAIKSIITSNIKATATATATAAILANITTFFGATHQF